MGFKDLRAFNLAMLAKQGWRLLQNEDSLFYKIYKARYFRNSSFLDAQLGSNPSYAWRSILEARVIIKRGTHWRVGDGQLSEVWEDKWVPTINTVLSPPLLNALPQDAKVNTLIDGSTRWGKESVIRDNFQVDVAEAILRIPLSFRGYRDKVMWSSDSLGIFSVKSAYRVARAVLKENSSPSVVSSQAISRPSSLWRAIWRCKIPNKIKLFMWRACKGILPSLDNLLKRGVAVNSDCILCSGIQESTVHSLHSCLWAKNVWFSHPLFGSLYDANHNTFGEWASLMRQKLSKEEFDLFCIVAWKIWGHRNHLVHGGTILDHQQTIQLCRDYLNEFTMANHCPRFGSHQSSAKWRPPSGRVVKLNCDGAIFEATGRTGLGLVVRNCYGKVSAAASINFLPSMDPAVVKLGLFTKRFPLQETWISTGLWWNLILQ